MLLNRIADRIHRRERVSFLFGTALTLPRHTGAPGVPGVANMCQRLAEELAIEEPIDRTAASYQKLFTHVIQRHGQERANQLIRRAVMGALKSQHSSEPEADRFHSGPHTMTEDECRCIQNDSFAWELNDATCALGDLLTRFPSTLGRDVFTTNFDPLIEIACEQNGGSAYSIALHADGAVPITHSRGVRVVHLHGFWLGSDTLHTSMQVNRRRPRLAKSLAHLLDHTLLVVVGYGGWDDVMMRAITDAVRNPDAHPDIAWAFRDTDATAIGKDYSHVLGRLGVGTMRGRANFYAGVDVHKFLPDLRRLMVYGPQSAISDPSRHTLPAESLQGFLDLVYHRFLRERLSGARQSNPEIGEEIQQLRAWGEHVPVAAALLVAHSVLHIYENSLPYSPREEDLQLVDFWPRLCLKQAADWLGSNTEPRSEELAMWPSIFMYSRANRHALDIAVVDAVRYACESVALYRKRPICDDGATSLVRAGQAVHCAMRVAGDDRLAVWGVVRAKLKNRLVLLHPTALH